MKKFIIILIGIIAIGFSSFFITEEAFGLSCTWEECSTGGSCESSDDCDSGETCESGTCMDCEEKSENCPSDGWHDTGSTRWVSTGECGEKEQEKEEWRGYYCPQCRYNVFETRWSDTGRTSEDDSVCTPDNYEYCSGDKIMERQYACSGTSCSFDENETVKDCSNNDYNYCSGDDVRTQHYTCSNESCVKDGTSHTEHCPDRDGYYCESGNDTNREYREYYCSGGSCSYNVTGYNDCANRDGWYCSSTGSCVREYREYYCSGGSCSYNVTDTVNCDDQNSGWYCGTNYDSEYRSHYCTYGAGYGASCGAYEVTKTEYCPSLNGWYCTDAGAYGSGYDSGETLMEYREYNCSGGSCSLANVTDTLSCDPDYYDWSMEEYGERCLCAGATESENICEGDYSGGCPPEENDSDYGGVEGSNYADSEMQSIPIAYNLEWNKVDHNYDESIHERDGYPYCASNSPHYINLSWDYHSQTNHNYKKSYLQVSKGDKDFTNNLVNITTTSKSYLIDGTRLEFSTDYYWRVSVEDEKRKRSEWFYYQD